MSATAAPIYVFPVVGCKATYAKSHHDYQATDIQAKAGCKYVAPIGGTITIPQPSIVNLPHVVAPTGTTGPSRIEGVTVGMAINKAVDICLRTGDINEDTLWHWSSTLIRLAQKLQAGNLAPESGIEKPSDEEQPY